LNYQQNYAKEKPSLRLQVKVNETWIYFSILIGFLILHPAAFFFVIMECTLQLL
jgi:hypothetical protein